MGQKLVSAALIVLGLAMACFGIYFIVLGYEAKGWVETEGRVVSTRVRVDTDIASKTTTRRNRYFPSITYRWTVDGTTYTASRYRLGETHEKYSERSEARAVAAKFPAGSAVSVYYDEDHPDSAVLEPKLSVGVFVPLPLGLLFMTLGSILLIFGPALQQTAKRDQQTAPSGDAS